MSVQRVNIIYIDPPWQYEDKALAGNRGAGCKYTVLSLNDLKNLPIEQYADTDCIMFMWVTFPKLLDGTCMDVMKAWGFTPKTCAFNWVKYHNNLNPFMGMGRWTRANSEICVLGTMGKPKRLNAGVRQLIETMDDSNYMPDLIQSVPERHSKKPDIVRQRIVELCGDLPRVEIFAREYHDGWACIGNELGSKI